METEEDSYLTVSHLLAKSDRMHRLSIPHQLHIEDQRQRFTTILLPDVLELLVCVVVRRRKASKAKITPLSHT